MPAAMQSQISLDRLSIWASSHRLSILAALVANLADLRRLIDHRSQREEVLKLPQVHYQGSSLFASVAMKLQASVWG